VLIIRKVDRQATVVGGAAQEDSKGVGEQYCAPGEVCGDSVSQLQKVAFEVFEPGKGAPESGSPGQTGAFLSCISPYGNTSEESVNVSLECPSRLVLITFPVNTPC
jgi:recombining binding protein (suppressor of hairless)